MLTLQAHPKPEPEKEEKDEIDLAELLTNILEVDPVLLKKYFPALLPMLIDLIASRGQEERDTATRKVAFKNLLWVI